MVVVVARENQVDAVLFEQADEGIARAHVGIVGTGRVGRVMQGLDDPAGVRLLVKAVNEARQALPCT
jgi:phosphoglycerate dehydrogenase-like enzyme